MTLTIHNPTIPALTATLAENLAEQTRLAITADGNTLHIPTDAGESALKHLIGRLGAMQGGTEQLDTVLRYNIGRAVLALASSGPERRTPEEVIDEADLPALLKRSAKTVANWAYVAGVIPPEELKPVAWTVLAEAAASPPKDPGKALEWREERQKIIAEAAEHPEETTAKQVREKVKKLKTQLGSGEKTVRESVQELMSRHVKLSRLAEVANQMTVRRCGFESVGSLRDCLTAVENELINRNALQPDPAAEIFYWVKEIKDVEPSE